MRRRLILAAVVLAAACGGDSDGTARVTIPTGATMATAADSLQKKGVIESPRLFRLYAKLRRSDRGIKAGTYVLRRNAGWGEVLDALRSGKGIVAIVTIPEGYRLTQIEPLLVARLGVPRDSVLAAMRDSALRERLDVPIPDLEGYLFPDTYFFAPGTSARDAIETMVRRFEQQWKPEWSRRLDTLALSRHDALTLASIVEGEAKLAPERPVIAAVYWNRLRRGMLLQADPTVQYALPQYQSRLMNRHLTIQSRYNTYKHKGLPPGPIGAPGAASIEATLYPANVPYLYFVAYPDGHHEFRVRLTDHQNAARAARRAWDAQARAAKRGTSGNSTKGTRRTQTAARPEARQKTPGKTGGG